MINLKQIVPISFVASHLAKMIKQAESGPVIITQKGYPAGVLLSTEEYQRLKFFELYANAEPVNASDLTALQVQFPTSTE